MRLHDDCVWHCRTDDEITGTSSSTCGDADDGRDCLLVWNVREAGWSSDGWANVRPEILPCNEHF